MRMKEKRGEDGGGGGGGNKNGRSVLVWTVSRFGLAVRH